MMLCAEEVIVVADSTKFGHTSLARLCPLSEIDILVTDDEIPDKWRQRLKTEGVRLIVADASAEAAQAASAACEPPPATS
jgi:DeoR/GlpR family transcriptional regulator of sugar metabolism